MNYAQSFEEFAKSTTSLDLALYAGVGLVLFVLFKDRLSPVQSFLLNLLEKVKATTNQKVSTSMPVKKEVLKESLYMFTSPKTKDELFMSLVSSWKETRNLAEQSGCTEAVKVADQMFPYLSPNGCEQESNKVVVS